MKANSEKPREFGKDFILRADIIEEDNEHSTIPIQINQGKFKNTIFIINELKFLEENSEDDTVGVDISYDIIKFNEDTSIEELSSDPEFVTMVGDIVTTLLINAAEKAQNESGTDNNNESVEE